MMAPNLDFLLDIIVRELEGNCMKNDFLDLKFIHVTTKIIQKTIRKRGLLSGKSLSPFSNLFSSTWTSYTFCTKKNRNHIIL